MSLTQEDLRAISDLIDVKLDRQEQNINKRFDTVDKKFEEVDKRFDAVDKRFEQIEVKLDEHSKRFDAVDKRFEEVDKSLNDIRTEFKEMLIDNNMLIAEHVQRIVSESEKRLLHEIHEVKIATAQNSYDIAILKQRVS